MLNFTGNYFWLIYLCSFLVIFLFSIGVSQFFRQQGARKKFVGRIRFAGDGGFPTDGDQPLDARKPGGRFPLLNIFSQVGRAALPETDFSHSAMRVKFLRAGIRHEGAMSVYWGFKIFSVVALPAIFILARVTVFNLITYQLTMIITILCALLGFYLPDIWLRQKADKRKEKLLEALPDGLDLLVICVEAGMGLDSAVNRVSQELKLSSKFLSDEFHFMNLELRAGKQRDEALRNLALRTNLNEINSLTTLLIQTDKFGTSMADALRVFSDSFRTERQQRAEEIAAKLPVKMLFPLIFFIFPSLFVVILGPAAINIYQNIFMATE
jgi:tight adherence protein C